MKAKKGKSAMVKPVQPQPALAVEENLDSKELQAAKAAIATIVAEQQQKAGEWKQSQISAQLENKKK